ncbi:hypothetical protein [Desertivirga arenae]|uniref:hypothetical protein n=1 Tax=Desertivirga arenae TaxID=2810309 RepID=UPI001A97A0CC|nr:hypothetical protein [Pedobacter sp. SYSU D00823]
MNFLIPLYLSEFIKQEEEQFHLLLVSWRYSTFLEPILAGNNPPELAKKGESLICEEGGVVVVKDNSSNILNRGLHLAQEKLRCREGSLVFAIVPASDLLMKELRSLPANLPLNLILIVQGNIPSCNSEEFKCGGWHLSTTRGEDSGFLTNVIRAFQDGEIQKPQLVIVETPWEQIII